MSIWPFNRKQNQSTDAQPDVQQYYQADKREKPAVAGLLALGSLLITVLLALGIFFGGRWVYRTLFTDDNGSEETAQQADTDQNQPATNEGQDESEATPPVAVAPPQPTPTPAPTSTSTSQPDNLPNTGPGETALFILSVMAASSLLYYAYGDRQNYS